MANKVMVSFRMDPELLERLDGIVPQRKRSAFLHNLLENEVERLHKEARRQRRYAKTLVRENILAV